MAQQKHPEFSYLKTVEYMSHIQNNTELTQTATITELSSKKLEYELSQNVLFMKGQ